MADKPFLVIGYGLLAVSAAVFGAIVLLVAGIWYDWPIAVWLWELLP